MITLNGLENYVPEVKKIKIRFCEYDLKIINVKEWICIMKLIQDDNFEKNIINISKEVVKIVIPTFLGFDSLFDFEKIKLLEECIYSFSQKNEKENINEEDSNIEKIEINIFYLIGQVCKTYNMSLKEVEELEYIKFLSLKNAVEALESDYFLKLSEIIDNNIYLKSKNTSDNYSKTLEKYKKRFEENGIKVINGLDKQGLLELKRMLGGI